MPKHKYKNYSDEDIIKAVQEAKSIAQVLRNLDLVPRGGNYANIKKHIQRLKCSTDHFTGQAHLKGQEIKPFRDLKSRRAVRRRLIQERGHTCEECGLSEWRGKPISIEVEHSNGVSNDNSPDNLRLLCPNCHAQTPTYRRRKSSLNP